MKQYGIAVCLLGLLTACGGGSSGGGGEGHSVQIPSDTDKEESITITPECPENFECTVLAVPKNYKNDDDTTVNIYYAVHKATDESNRIGTLFFNYGGPGGAAVWPTSYMVNNMLPAEIVERFDIVAMDPRGSGYSEYAAELTMCAKANNCTEQFKEIAPFIGSNSIVQDYDQVRAHLGEETISFLGYSYGTRLGSLYADTFPERLRALVLDSPMAPDLTNHAQLLIESASGYQLIAEHRLANNQQRIDALAELVASYNAPDNQYYIERELADGTVLSSADLFTTLAILAGHNYDLSGYWKNIETGVFKFLDEQDSALLREQTQKIVVPEMTNDDYRSGAMFKAVVCTDESMPLSINDIENKRALFDAASSIFALSVYMNGSLTCADWPNAQDPIATVADMQNKLSIPQVLLIKGQYDPATPNIWGERMAASFADLASVITVNNLVDHAFSYSKTLSCVDLKTTQYLLDPSIEITDTSCEGSATKVRRLAEKQFIHPAKTINSAPRF